MLSGASLYACWLDIPVAGFGMERWPFSLHGEATSGYFTQAQRLLDDRTPLRDFLHGYQAWLKDQDSFHIGTHPPGLIALNYVLLDWFRARPALAAEFIRRAPPRFAAGVRALAPRTPFGAPEYASLLAAALFTIGCALLPIPLIYGLARRTSEPPSAWLAAALWPTIPAVPLFLPLGDCLYPALAALVVLPIVWAPDRSVAISFVLGLVFGAALWFGMSLSLAFLAVLPVATCAPLVEIVADGPKGRLHRIGRLVFAAGGAIVAFGLATLWANWSFELNLPAIWALNLHKHKGFYDHMPRTYAVWVWVNLVEFAAVLGPATLLAAGAGLFVKKNCRWTPDAMAVAAFATLAALDLSGRNLSETARLWIFLTPFFCAAAGRAIHGLSTGGLAIFLLCQSAVAWLLLGTVEPLLPIQIVQP
jgi:hypothetical protein